MKTEVNSDSSITIDNMLHLSDIDCMTEPWRADLENTMDQLFDSRKSTSTSRERVLSAYNYSLMTHYANDVIVGKWEDIISIMLSIIKLEPSVKQTTLALRGT